MQISLIAAVANNRAIGYQNQLPWHLPADLKHFKKITLGKPVIMGRKTFESIGKALPERLNIIVTRNSKYQAANCITVSSFEKALQEAGNAPEAMVIGGADLFREALPVAARLYFTFIDADVNGDVFFPDWVESEWQEIERQNYKADEKNPYDYSFVVLQRKL